MSGNAIAAWLFGILVVCFLLIGLSSYFSDGFRNHAKRDAKRKERAQRIADAKWQQQRLVEAERERERHREQLKRQFQQDMEDAAYLDELARQEIERRAQLWREGRPRE